MKGAALALAALALVGAPAGRPQQPGIDMVNVPGGAFEMGSATGRDDERPVHSVRIGAFSLSRTAVTVGQYRAFVDASGYRTEAEWEYAARGGRSGYCDADLDSVAWFEGNSGGSTHPVGSKRPNAYGLYDMIGNVWEWCSDWYGGYPPSLQTNPTGSSDGSNRINRGEAWYGASRGCWRRGKNTPDDRGNGLGFRLAADASPGPVDREGT